MDSTEAKALVDNLRKAKNASKPYFWSFVLEGSDGEPCLFFEKKETAAKKKAKEARKTARKKKVAMGMMDYADGKMILRSDGAIADNLIEKGIKKLVKAHGELGLLKRLKVDSSPIEAVEPEPVKKKKKTKPQESSNEEVETTDDSAQWATGWETQYDQAKGLLKQASKSDAAKKDKVKNKISDYKDRLKTARSAFKAATPPYDPPTRTELQALLDKAWNSIIKMADKLGIPTPSIQPADASDGDGSHADELDDNIMETLLEQATQTDTEQSMDLDKKLDWPARSARLVTRLNTALQNYDSELDRFQTALLNHPEVSNDPRVTQVQQAFSNIDSLLPKRSNKLHKYLEQLGSITDRDDHKVALKKAKKVVEHQRKEYESNPVLTFVESNLVGQFSAKSAMLDAFTYIETILHA